MENGIEGKVIVITGASSGMGEASAILLAAHGAKVVLGARRADRLKVVAERIRKEGGESVFLETDVTWRDDLTSLTALAIESFGRLNVMINNAGISQLGEMEELDIAGWE